ncbi:hypothetical protein H9P43_004544 [Blastocladiella emersonii ATCC 22665]|nr:hypothetical protein H9P43_004544 [Blastocladiella emersonii ATCC 22665]
MEAHLTVAPWVAPADAYAAIHDRVHARDNADAAPRSPLAGLTTLDHAGVLHEAQLADADRRVVWRVGGHVRAALSFSSGTVTLAVVAVAFCYFPAASDAPFLAVALADASLRFLDARSGDVVVAAVPAPPLALFAPARETGGGLLLAVPADPTPVAVAAADVLDQASPASPYAGRTRVVAIVDHPLAQPTPLVLDAAAPTATATAAAAPDAGGWRRPAPTRPPAPTRTPWSLDAGARVLLVDGETLVAASPAAVSVFCVSRLPELSAADLLASLNSPPPMPFPASPAVGGGAAATAARRSLRGRNSRDGSLGSPAAVFGTPRGGGSAGTPPRIADAGGSGGPAAVVDWRPERARVALTRVAVILTTSAVTAAFACLDVEGQRRVALVTAAGALRIIDPATGGIVDDVAGVIAAQPVRYRGRSHPLILLRGGPANPPCLALWLGAGADLLVPVATVPPAVAVHGLADLGGIAPNFAVAILADGSLYALHLVHPRWDASPALAAVRAALESALPASTTATLVREPPETPLSLLLARACPTLPLRQAATRVLAVLVAEWSLDALRERDTRHLASVVVRLAASIGWTRHVEHVALRYAVRELNVAAIAAEGCGGEPLLAAVDPDEPQTLDLARWAIEAARSGTLEPWSVDADVAPVAAALEAIVTALVSDASVELAMHHVVAMHRANRAAIASLPWGWRIVVTAVVELARDTTLPAGGSVPCDVVDLLRRPELAPAPAEPAATADGADDDEFAADPAGSVPRSHLALVTSLLGLPTSIVLAHPFSDAAVSADDPGVRQIKQDLADAFALRACAVVVGRSALEFRTARVHVARQVTGGSTTTTTAIDALPPPTRIDVSATFSKLDGEPVPGDSFELDAANPDLAAYFAWPNFHAGVADALALDFAGSPEPADIEAWLWSRRRTSGPVATWAGTLLGLGLTGRLRGVTPIFTLRVLGEHNPFIESAFLLGRAAGEAGSADPQLFRLIAFAHPAAFAAAPGTNPAALTEHTPLVVRATAVLAAGILHARAGDRHPGVTRALLAALADTFDTASDAYRMAAGIGFAFVLLGSAKHAWVAPLVGLTDPDKPSAALTAPAAYVALGWAFFDSAEKGAGAGVARMLVQGSSEVPPDAAFYRALAGHLVRWSSIGSGIEFVRRARSAVKGDAGEMATQQVADAVEAAACFAIALRFAGTANEEAIETCLHYADAFAKRGSRMAVDFHDRLSTASARDWAPQLVMYASLIAAGTADPAVLHRAAALQQRYGTAIQYRHHLAASIALGFLTLGCGKFTLDTRSDPVAALALFAATHPGAFPASTFDAESALPTAVYLWVLAVRPHRVLTAREVGNPTGSISATATVELADGTTSRVNLPARLPHTAQVCTVHVGGGDSDLYPVTVTVEASLDAPVRVQRKRAAGPTSKLTIANRWSLPSSLNALAAHAAIAGSQSKSWRDVESAAVARALMSLPVFDTLPGIADLRLALAAAVAAVPVEAGTAWMRKQGRAAGDAFARLDPEHRAVVAAAAVVTGRTPGEVADEDAAAVARSVLGGSDVSAEELEMVKVLAFGV